MAIDEVSTVLEPRPLPNFVETPAVKQLTERALSYIKAGFAIHLRGATGTGETTLALHVASKHYPCRRHDTRWRGALHLPPRLRRIRLPSEVESHV